MQYIIVFITTSDKKEAEKIASGLLDKHIIACANIIEGVESHFWWKSKKESAKECLLIAKTTKTKLKKVDCLVKSLHSYEVPEIIGVSIVDGYEPYLDWIEKEVS